MRQELKHKWLWYRIKDLNSTKVWRDIYHRVSDSDRDKVNKHVWNPVQLRIRDSVWDPLSTSLWERIIEEGRRWPR